jgi:class 3 adenylate cyclase
LQPGRFRDVAAWHTPRALTNPTTHYAKTLDDVHVAYQVFGEGVDLVFVPGFVSHIDNYWEEPSLARMLRHVGRFSRVVMFDKRGTGLSSRVSRLPSMDERMDDVRAVMDAENIDQAAIFGISEGGSLATLFAAHHPERCSALVLYGAFAQFSSWFPNSQSLDLFFAYVASSWGSGQSLPFFAPSSAEDEALRQWWGKFERLGGDPKAVVELMEMNSQIDITDILGTVQTPTLVLHRAQDVLVDYEGGRQLADGIPGARLVTLPGPDHLPWVGDAMAIVEEIEEFLTGSRTAPSGERTLATVLFTDIVDSTGTAHRVGDTKWGDVLDAHNGAVRSSLARFRGREIKTLGDGFLATFDGPGRAIQCALEIREAARRLGIQVRAGLHTGEVQFLDGDVGGIAVHIASRVIGAAAENEVLVSRTVKDLVAGSGIDFETVGVHTLKGVDDKWELYRALP